jgi:uroporphyrin-3 C-methyltransferase
VSEEKSGKVADQPSAEPEEEKTASAAPSSAPSAAPSAALSAAAPPAPKTRRTSLVGWLALLLVLAMAGGALWLTPQLRDIESQLSQRVSSLETKSSAETTDLNALSQRLGTQLRSGLDEAQSAAGASAAKLSTQLKDFDARLAGQQEELSRFSANDRDSWLLAEAEYLLRLANQRLLMAGDADAAQALLGSADRVLRELKDVGLHEVRAAVASDLAAVRAIPSVDVEGIYLRLAAMSEQAGKLVIFRLPEQVAAPRPDAAPTWEGRLEQGYKQALAKLSEYIIIRRRDVPMQALMDPQWEGLVRQNLRMLLEQAQVALLSGNQNLYTQSLERAEHWVDQFIDSDEVAARAVARELRLLASLNVSVPLPDISGSANALDAVIERRLQPGGGE